MSNPQPERDPFAELLRKGSEVEEAEAERARAAFLSRLDERLEAPPRAVPKLLWLAPLAAAAAVLLVWAAGWSSSELDYAVSGATDEDGYVRVTASEPARVTFSDETILAVDPGARLRIGERRPTGALVSVEQGRLSAHVTHTSSSDWRFVAGPFRVHVTGTRFDLSWDAEQERLDVTLHEGSVEVEGYAGSGPVAVRRGQRFHGDARLRRMQVSDATAGEVAAGAVDTPAASPAPGAAGPSAADAGAVDEPAPTKPTPGPASEAKTSWAKLVAKGDFQRVVTEATARGTQSCIASADASDLTALADAARYTGRTDLAEQSLLSLHRRFTASSGDRAAFLLGRLQEGRGRHAEARGWYQKSLAQAPGGSFAAESLAGKMRTVKALEGPAAAASVAREYLKKYPSGVHAEMARQLVESP